MSDILRLVVTQSSDGAATQLEGLKPGVESLEQLKKLRRAAESFLHSTVEAVLAACPHHRDPSLIFKTAWDGACCRECEVELGWFCRKSPTRVCEYDESDSNHDDCIHCGEPEERK